MLIGFPFIWISGDSLSYHDGMEFDTYDVTSGTSSNSGCAAGSGGGWWYDGCYHANINGGYNGNGTWKAVSWLDFRGHKYSLKRTEMKIRRL